MPHSSGGGSSSGGSHSSSSHSSHYGSSGSKISKRYFPGAKRYRYTDSRGVTTYYYVSGGYTRTPFPLVLLFVVSSLLLFVIFSILNGMADQLLFVPEKLDPAGYPSGVCISDRTGLMETREMEEAMRGFLDATGVSPAVEFVYADEVTGDLESYAFSRYNTLFDDEKHWLIELVLPRGFRDEKLPKWKYEGMIGDECFPAVSGKTEKRFTTTVDWQLLRSNGQNIEQRIAAAWSEMARKAPQTQVNDEVALSGGFFLIFFGVMLWICVRDLIRDWRLERAEEDPMPQP